MRIRSLLTLGCLALAAFAPRAASAQALCQPGGYAIGFFNGAFSTQDGAQRNLDALKLLYGNTYNEQPVTYDLFYNPTGGWFEDVAELFQQSAKENGGFFSDRWEYFWDLLRGAEDDSVTDSWAIANSGPNGWLSALADEAFKRGVSSLLAAAGTPPTNVTYAEHRTRLDAHMTQREKIVLVGHSQGNLFVNAAYDYGKSVVGDQALRAVHVAPVSNRVVGSYTLADRDKIAQILSELGPVVPANVSIPAVPPEGDRPPPFDGSGHQFIETYLDSRLATYASVKNQLADALNSVVAPSTSGSTGYFTVTLTWDGSGDVDLHATEPGNAHVYYGHKTGQAGVLDVDNTVANGPEHYYASCDPLKLLAGDYAIGINNYAGALGRTATVQVASYSNGVLLSRSLDVGAVKGSAGNDSPIPVFTIHVSKAASGDPVVSAE
ncbi:MAG: hypothetical protein ABIQ16_28885 [Polyangiaceae bacterium]